MNDVILPYVSPQRPRPQALWEYLGKHCNPCATSLCYFGVWVFALPAVSHHVPVRRLDEDVFHIKQNIHEVLPSHGAAICVLPRVLQKKQDRHP